ncbi:unnamed protein product [Brugia timori]|uniref:Chromo domain-containing protein n=1 Tax=Brugia timori TaxID=42155 RepID=A0A0R3Q3V4_9BILA|nr:unnamed protein product [Brugia timori]
MRIIAITLLSIRKRKFVQSVTTIRNDVAHLQTIVLIAEEERAGQYKYYVLWKEEDVSNSLALQRP